MPTTLMTTWRLGLTLAIVVTIASLDRHGLWLDAAKLNTGNVALMRALRAPDGPSPDHAANFAQSEASDARGPMTARLTRAEGIALLWAGQSGRAVAAFEQVAALEGNHASPVTQLWLGDAYRAADHLEAAIRAWDRAGGARILSRKADELRRAGQLAAATAVFQAAIDLHPDAATGYAGLGQIAVDRQDWPAAEARFTQALALDPNAPEAHTGLAAVLVQSRRHADARAHLERAIALKPDAMTAYLLMGDTFVREGVYAMARPWYDRAAALFPASAEPDIRLALAAIAQAQTQEAFAALDAAGRKDPNSVQRYIVLARAYRLAGGPQGIASAIAALEQAVDRAPQHVWAWIWLGDSYREVGRCGDSQAAYARAATLDANNAQVTAHQAVACPVQSNFETTDKASRYEENQVSFQEMTP